MHMNLGLAQIEAGNYTSALRELLSATEAAPGDPRIHYYLALVYQGKGFAEKAMEECRAAIKLKDDYSEAQNLLGTMYLTKGQAGSAVESFKKALDNALYDTPHISLYNLGRAYFSLGDYSQALLRYQEAAGKNYRGDLLPMIENGMGRVRYAQGDFEHAEAHFRRSAELAPTYAESFYWLGESLMKQGKTKEAKKAFESAVEIAPGQDFSRKAKEYIGSMK